jgi:hypothetical protein
MWLLNSQKVCHKVLVIHYFDWLLGHLTSEEEQGLRPRLHYILLNFTLEMPVVIQFQAVNVLCNFKNIEDYYPNQ